MKKLLYVIFLPFFLNSCDYIPDLVYNNMGAKNAPNNATMTRYWDYQYVINFPDDAEDSERMRVFLLAKGLEPVSVCPCSNKLQLWGTGAVRPTPDGQDQLPPPPPPTGGSITKNYMVVDVDTSLKFTTSSIPLSIEYPQPPNSNRAVLIAIDDSGIELSNEENSLSPFLYRNPQPSLVCNSTTAREGIYGYNVLNRLNGRYNSPNVSNILIEPQDNDGHGTFINGIISGKASTPPNRQNRDFANNFIGSSEDVTLKIIHTRFFSYRETQATLFDALCGIHYALDKGAKVINASWRSLATEPSSVDSMTKAYLPTLKAIKDRHAILVTGSGNDSLKNGDESEIISFAKVFPASFSRDPVYGQYVIAVGAWDLERGKVADFSNEGSYVDIYAPGVNITSTHLQLYPFMGQAYGSGTSYAAPYVSRLAAILIGKGMPAADVKKYILNLAENLPYSPPYYRQMQAKMLKYPQRAMQ